MASPSIDLIDSAGMEQDGAVGRRLVFALRQSGGMFSPRLTISHGGNACNRVRAYFGSVLALHPVGRASARQVVGCGCAGELRGFPSAPPCTGGKLARLRACHPCGRSASHPPPHRGPTTAGARPRARSRAATPHRLQDGRCFCSWRARCAPLFPGPRLTDFWPMDGQKAPLQDAVSLWLLSLAQTRESSSRARRAHETALMPHQPRTSHRRRPSGKHCSYPANGPPG